MTMNDLYLHTDPDHMVQVYRSTVYGPRPLFRGTTTDATRRYRDDTVTFIDATSDGTLVVHVI